MAKRKIGFSAERHADIGQQLKDMKNNLAAMNITQHYRTDSKVRRKWNLAIQAIQSLQSALDTDAYQNHPDEFDNDWYYGKGSVYYGNNL